MKQDDELSEKTEAEEPVVLKLSDKQRAQIERNRQRALLIRQARTQSKNLNQKQDQNPKKSRLQIDTGAGFFIEEEDEILAKAAPKVKYQPGPVLSVENLICSDCQKEFMESYLYERYDLAVCDTCRKKDEEKYKLITKTEAKTTYLLKDCDFDKREPPLKFIIYKNPQNSRWGDMKLYLKMQVEARALEVWGSEEKIEEAHEERAEKRDKSKQKKFDKRVKELRMAVRSSLWKKTTAKHEHEYGEESYDEESDEYSKTCKSCGYVLTYEKM